MSVVDIYIEGGSGWALDSIYIEYTDVLDPV